MKAKFERQFQRAVALQQQGDFRAAVQAYRRLVARAPGMANAYNNLGAALGEMGEYAEALQCFQRAVEVNPAYFEAWMNLATGLKEQHREDQAIAALERACALAPKRVDIHHRLGVWLRDVKRYDGALVALERAAALAPGDPAILEDLAALHISRSDLSQALRLAREAMRNGPRAASLNVVACCLRLQGDATGAVGLFRQALKLSDDSQVHSNLLLSLNCCPDVTPEELCAEHFRAEQFVGRLPHSVGHTNSQEPGRRLRVAYLSPDLHEHSVAFFIAAVLQHHDPRVVEVYAYSDWPRPDSVTAQLRRHVSVWREAHALSDDRLARQIREDKIDVLVDLAGHTAGGRPLLLARKPAPLQFTYLGYPNTTGLRAVDCRITDEVADPPGATEHLHTETLVRLRGGFLCYTPPARMQDVIPPPCLRQGWTTFGSFNLLAKINGEVVRVWSRVLKAVPDSRLLLKGAGLSEEAARERIHSAFAEHGIERNRVQLMGRLRRKVEHFRCYGQVDIALDPFPYNGTTTTCEALWMGVPVITLAGRHHAARVGASILSAIGRPDWVAESEDDYVRIAVRLAHDQLGLSSLRFSMRHRMRQSHLMDGLRVARELETAYRSAWKQWCDRSVRKQQPA